MRTFFYRIKALRLISLPLSLSGIMMGGFLANTFGHFSYLIFVLALITSAALHLTCNLANDIGDFKAGNDSFESIGYETMLVSGKLTIKEVTIMIIILISIAVSSGVILIYFALGNLISIASITMFIIGICAVTAAIYYTIGKKPYGYRALGDLAVFLFFGLVAVLGTFFLLTQQLPLLIFLPAISMGCMTTGAINLNNIRDINNDRKYRKTIPILIGIKNAKHYHTFLVFMPFLLMLLFNTLLHKPLHSYLFLLLLPLVIVHVISVYKQNGLELNKQMGVLILITLLFVSSTI